MEKVESLGKRINPPGKEKLSIERKNMSKKKNLLKKKKSPQKGRMPGDLRPLAIIMKKLFSKLWLAVAPCLVTIISIVNRNV